MRFCPEPSPPMTWSSPSPGSTELLPGPPSIWSLPAAPKMMSSPPSPQIRSSPAPPKMMSEPSPATITSLPSVPRSVSTPSVPTIVAGWPKQVVPTCVVAPAELVSRTAPTAAAAANLDGRMNRNLNPAGTLAGNSLESCVAPHADPAPLDGLETLSASGLEDLVVRMDERPELDLSHRPPEIEGRHEEPGRDVAGREAQDDPPPRVLRRGADELVGLGVTADDPVHDDDVGRLDGLSRGDEVRDPPLGAVVEPVLAQELPRLVLVPGRELDVRRVGRTGLEKLDLDRADAAADLEHGAVRPRELDEPASRLAEPAAAVPACVLPCLALAEDGFVAGRAAAGRHGVLSLGDSRFQGLGERLADRLEVDPVEDVLEEAAHDQPLGLAAREPSGHQIEELLAVDLPEGRAVGAADVVREDLEPRDRVGMRVGREQQVAVLLVRVRLLRVALDADHPAPDRSGRVSQGALEREVGGRVRRDVLLERVVVEML